MYQRALSRHEGPESKRNQLRLEGGGALLGSRSEVSRRKKNRFAASRSATATPNVTFVFICCMFPLSRRPRTVRWWIVGIRVATFAIAVIPAWSMPQQR